MGGALSCLGDAGSAVGGSNPITADIQNKIDGSCAGFITDLPSTYRVERSCVNWDVWAGRPNPVEDEVYKQKLTWGVSPESEFQSLTVKRCTGEEAKGALEDQIHEQVDGDIDQQLQDTPEPAKTAGKRAADAAIEKAAEKTVEEAAKKLTEQIAANPENFKAEGGEPEEGGSKPTKPPRLQRRRR